MIRIPKQILTALIGLAADAIVVIGGRAIEWIANKFDNDKEKEEDETSDAEFPEDFYG